MISLELEKDDLISLVKGVNPSYEQMGHKVIKQCGRYSGSYDRWEWDTYRLKELYENELLALYLYLKGR